MTFYYLADLERKGLIKRTRGYRCTRFQIRYTLSQQFTKD
jgi:hypothetical protein